MGKTLDLEENPNKPNGPLEATLLEGPFFEHFWELISREMDLYPEVWELWTKDSIRISVLSGQMQCWAVGTEKAYHFVVFTQIGNYPAMRVLQVVFAFGSFMEESVPLLAAMFEKFAMIQGCKKIDFTMGRMGWERICKKFGMRKTAIVMTYDVHSGQRTH